MSSTQRLSSSENMELTEDEFLEKYNIGEILGQGTFGEVRRAERLSDGLVVAMKKILKTQSAENIARNEVIAMRRVSHPSILKLEDVWEDENTCYIVSEFAAGGELLNAVIDSGSYSEAVAADIMKQLTSAVMHMHDHCGIVHRDLKLDNVLLAEPGSTVVKVSDMGLCGMIRNLEGGADELVLHGRSGTLNYMAPEVVTRDPRGYGKAVDYWSVGVVLYILLVGHFPFHAKSDDVSREDEEIEQAIIAGDFSFEGADPDLSESAKDLVRKLLVVDPDERYNGTQVLRHPWLKGGARRGNMSPLMIDSLRAFMAKKKLRRGVNAIRAGIRMRRMFSSMNSSIQKIGSESSPQARDSIASTLQDELAYCNRELEQLREELDLTQLDLAKERAKNEKLTQAVRKYIRAADGPRLEVLALLDD